MNFGASLEDAAAAVSSSTSYTASGNASPVTHGRKVQAPANLSPMGQQGRRLNEGRRQSIGIVSEPGSPRSQSRNFDDNDGIGSPRGSGIGSPIGSPYNKPHFGQHADLMPVISINRNANMYSPQQSPMKPPGGQITPMKVGADLAGLSVNVHASSPRSTSPRSPLDKTVKPAKPSPSAGLKAPGGESESMLRRGSIRLKDAAEVPDEVPKREENALNGMAKWMKVKVPILANLEVTELKMMARYAHEKVFKAGDIAVQQGEVDKGFYVIHKGKAKVSRIDDQGVETAVATLKTGDCFGECAHLRNPARGATVTAHSMLQVLFVDKVHFMELFSSEVVTSSGNKFARRSRVSEAVMGPTPLARTSTRCHGLRPSSAMPNAPRDKSDAVTGKLLAALKEHSLFSGIKHQQLGLIVDELWLKRVPPQTSIYTQGDPADNFFIVESGSFDELSNGARVGIKKPCELIGELAVMYNHQRKTTVTAREESKVWVMDRFTFRRIRTDVSIEELQKRRRLLKVVPLMQSLSGAERAKVAEALEMVRFSFGATVVTEQSHGDALHIIASGTAGISKVLRGMSEGVGSFGEGQYFGDAQLLKAAPWNTTVTATSVLDVLRLDLTAFRMLMGKKHPVLAFDVKPPERSAYDNSKTIPAEVATASPISKPKKAPKRAKVDIPYDRLTKVGLLGKGSFGTVTLVRDSKGGLTYALKALSIEHVVKTKQQKHTLNEKLALENLDHPFIIKQYNTYRDHTNLFILLEPALGGELFTLLRSAPSQFYLHSHMCIPCVNPLPHLPSPSRLSFAGHVRLSPRSNRSSTLLALCWSSSTCMARATSTAT
jgi:CRP-like cAMP-binding protein